MGLPTCAGDKEEQAAKPKARNQFPPKYARAIRAGDDDETIRIKESRRCQLDAHLSQVPASLRYDLASLVSFITRPCRSDAERTHVIYRWITCSVTYDLDAYYRPTSTLCDLVKHKEAVAWETDDVLAVKVLQTGKALCVGYAAIFQLVCRMCNIPCVRIRGFAKGCEYIPGSKDGGSVPNHMWNAAFVNDRWRLVDTCWGAGYLSSSSAREFHRRQTQFYLFTSPRDFARDHLPLNSEWQLLTNPIAVDDFHLSVCTKPAYFDLGIKNCSVDKGRVVCKNKYIFQIEFAQYTHVVYEMRHMATGEYFNSSMQVQCTGKTVEFTALPPEVGTYWVIICAVDPAEDKGRKSAVRRVIEFTLDCKEPFIALPVLNKLASGTKSCAWGPNKLFHKLYLDFPFGFQTVLQTEKGLAKIKLSTELDDTDFHGELHTPEGDSVGSVKTVTSNDVVEIIAVPPKPGIYKFVIFARSFTMNNFKSVCSFVLIS